MLFRAHLGTHPILRLFHSTKTPCKILPYKGLTKLDVFAFFIGGEALIQRAAAQVLQVDGTGIQWRRVAAKILQVWPTTGVIRLATMINVQPLAPGSLRLSTVDRAGR